MNCIKTLIVTLCITFFVPKVVFSQHSKPNLVIILTDEHNFRTLGCYRELLSEEQAFVWGKGICVETPNIDRLAHEGSICNNFYASSPVCTPSRASFVSGNYPISTNSYRNDIPMFDNVVTFAQVLKESGYATSYVGKWHLDGNAKPGFAPKRKFGFEDNRYMFNRGHWKALEDKQGNPAIYGKYDPSTQKQSVNLKSVSDENFATDYLTSKTLEIMERDKNKPFCVMLSIPDPHTPNTVRPPYDTMYSKMTFQKPKTLKASAENLPGWAGVNKSNIINEYNQTDMQRYFGMVKCIDDNVGRILTFLDKNNLSKNTIVVFTSDHGDLMGEHHKNDKGNPYEASAKIPFVLRYPAKVKAGKVIETAYNNTDFTPTILGLIGINSNIKTHGVDASKDFLSDKKKIEGERISYITSSNQTWIAAVTKRYKLVLSFKDNPWLIDLQEDPDELINYYNNPAYKQIACKMQAELLGMAKKYKDPIFKGGKELILE